MKNPRQCLAYLCGLLMAAGYMGAMGEMGHWNLKKLIIGLALGGGIAWGLLNEPDRATNKATLIMNALLLIGLNIWMVMTESASVAVFTVVWTVLFAAANLAFAKLHHKEIGDGKYPIRKE